MSQRPSTSKPRGVCRYFLSRRGCKNGDSCKFLHGDEDSLSPYDKSKACRYYAAGFCKHGDKCWFNHVNDTSPTTTPEVGASTAERQGPDADEDDVDMLCSICQDKPVTYGLLEDCSHVFCLECIRGWRDPNGKSPEILESGNTKRCPYCRTSSKFVTPSSVFYSNEQTQKAIAIANYKASMARIPCKYFEESLASAPYCPFGRDCFYQHKSLDGTMYAFDRGAEYYMTRRRRTRRSQNMGASSMLYSFLSRLRSVELPPAHRNAVEMLENVTSATRPEQIPPAPDNDRTGQEDPSQLRSLLEAVLLHLAEDLIGVHRRPANFAETAVGRSDSTLPSQSAATPEESRLLLSIMEVLLTTSNSSSNTAQTGEGQSNMIRQPQSAAPEEATSTALPLTRAFMESNIQLDMTEPLVVNHGPENNDEELEPLGSLNSSLAQRTSLTHFTHTRTEEASNINANGARVDAADNGTIFQVDGPAEEVGQSPEPIQHDVEVEGPEQLVSSQPEVTTDLLSDHSSLRQAIGNEPSSTEVPPNENRSRAEESLALSACEGDNLAQEHEPRSKPDARGELAPWRNKSNNINGVTSCNARRNGGQSFVTDGRGRVVATDDWTCSDGASLASWSPSTTVVTPPLPSTEEKAAEDAGALDDLD